MLRRLRSEGGFGLLELLVAMLVLSIALLALIGAFAAGAVSLHRSSRVSTAATLADSQLELYRALRYSAIGLDTTALASVDATYLADPALSGNPAQSTLTCATPLSAHPECNPSRVVSGPDRHSYRVDTYVVPVTPAGGRQVKQVTVVVRDGVRPGAPIAREASIFDAALG